MSDADFDRILEAQRAAYRMACRDKFEALRAAWERGGRGRANVDALLELERLAHTFAGSGPTFGFEALGEAARKLEREVHRLVITPATTTMVQRHQIEAAIEALERALPE
jgi:HPt (histidine-containing phosphotransfer) domain-containing protein